MIQTGFGVQFPAGEAIRRVEIADAVGVCREIGIQDDGLAVRRVREPLLDRAGGVRQSCDGVQGVVSREQALF